MKHANKIRKFGRNKDQRNALLRSQARSLILKEKITTTEAKARSLRPFVEKLLTLSKKGDLSSKKLIFSRLDKESGKKLTEVLASRYKERKGGAIRIIKLEPRKSDASPMAIVEFI